MYACMYVDFAYNTF